VGRKRNVSNIGALLQHGLYINLVVLNGPLTRRHFYQEIPRNRHVMIAHDLEVR